MRKSAVLLVILLASLAGAKQKSPKGSGLLLRLEAEFAADVAKNGHAAFSSHLAEDGVEVVDGGGFDSRDVISKEPEWPAGTSLTWTPIKVEMAASGDMGYTYGNFVYTTRNQDGKSVIARHGKYASIWKKQKDGAWKVVVDMGNSSPDTKTEK